MPCFTALKSALYRIFTCKFAKNKIILKHKKNYSFKLINNSKIGLALILGSGVDIDDSIVRGTTSRQIVKLLKRAGASEVHMRIASPTIEHPCLYGIDTPSYKELISANKSVEEVREYIGADSLTFLSIEALKESIGNDMNYSLVSFDGNYFIK